MGTFQSFRKAYGALKDSTTVGLAKVNSEFKELDIAVVKATNHVERPPKERHVRTILSATSVVRPRADVAYCIHAISRRLAKTRNWIVALKTLVVIHRTLREGDPTFREELLNYSRRGHVLQISNFKDDSSPLDTYKHDNAFGSLHEVVDMVGADVRAVIRGAAWDCSAWVRTYALFLEERLECFRILRYDIEAERLTKASPGATKVHSRTRLLGRDELLEQLPALQQLLYRLVSCQPEGAAYQNYLIQYALALVLKESFKIYCAINDGIINLVDMFFDMSRHDAVKALDTYKRAGQQAENLADFYEFCKGLDLARNFQFPTLRHPPPSFQATMEEYIREAPNSGSVSNRRLDYQEMNLPPEKPEEPEEPEEVEKQVEEVDEKDQEEEPQEEPEPSPEAEPAPLISTDGDLLGLSELNPHAAELFDSNALALAIVPPGHDPSSSDGAFTDLYGVNGSGWELALVTARSNNTTQVTQSKLAGGFDKLLLDSLYEDENARRQIQMTNAGYGYGSTVEAAQNPFQQYQQPQDSFFMSNSIAPQTGVQMAIMAQQQHALMLQQQQHQRETMMVPYQYGSTPQYPQQQQMQYQPQQQYSQHMGASNPFGDPYFSLPQNPTTSQRDHSLL